MFYLLISFHLLFLPTISLFILLRYLYKNGDPISVLNKIGLGLFFLLVAFGAIFCAFWTFAIGMGNAGNTCVTAALGIIPIGIIINIIAIPSILILVKPKSQRSETSTIRNFK